eukprot:Skav234616  [mRNA]  locus=scaffold835:32676:33380:+ [translate_table: standard]
MAPRSNNANPADLAKILKVHQREAPSLSFFSLPLENQIAEQEDLLKEMILLSSRPNATWITAACKQVWQRVDSELAGRFGKAMAACSQHCFTKAVQVTSGIKLPPAVKRLTQVINRSVSRPLSTGDKLRRSLKRVPCLPLKEMILLSSRPNATWITAACKQVWQRVDSELAGRFGKAMAACSQHCFTKAVQVTSGIKLPPAVKRLTQVINRSVSRPLSTGDKLRRSLKRVPCLQ